MITEKDLFMFVWHPTEIDTRKFLEIEAHKDIYKEILDMLIETYNASNKLLKKGEFKALMKKITLYKESLEK